MIFSMNKSAILPIENVFLFSAIFILLSAILLVLFFIFKIKLQKKRLKIFGVWILIWILTGGILYTTGYFGEFVNVEAANSRIFSREELIYDLQQIENSIMQENPFFFANKNEINDRFTETYPKIEDGMTELEFYRLINPLITNINCGHTNLSISKALQENREESAEFFPLKVTLINNELYFIEDYNNKINAGDKIIAINGISSNQIIEKLIENISGDGVGEAKQRYIISKYFNSRFYDFIDNSDKFTVEYINNEGYNERVILDSKYDSYYNLNAWGIHSAPYQDGNYYDKKIYNDYALLDLNVFMGEREDKFSDFLDEFFTVLKEKEISKLIIDLRGNFGGSPQMSKNLLSYLVSEKVEYFSEDLPFLQRILGFTDPITPAENKFNGETVFLTDGANFSTTAHFISMVKYHKLGTLIGRETGGSYVCTDSSKDMILDNTRMRLHYSTLVYELEVEGLPNNTGIVPEIYIKEEINNILNNKDMEMEYALQLLDIEEI